MERTELFSIFGHSVRVDQVLVIVAAIGMMVALDALVNRTKVGRGIRATAQNPEAAVLMGVDINRIVRMTFLIGGGMAGVAGALYLISYENTNYFIGFLFGIKAFTAAVLGGIGNLRGALVGGIRWVWWRTTGHLLRLRVEARGLLRHPCFRPDVPPHRNPR